MRMSQKICVYAAHINDMLQQHFYNLLGCVRRQHRHWIFTIRANDSEDDQEEWYQSQRHEERNRLNTIN